MKNDKLKRLAEKLRSSESAKIDLELIQNLSKVKGGRGLKDNPYDKASDGCHGFACGAYDL